MSTLSLDAALVLATETAEAALHLSSLFAPPAPLPPRAPSPAPPSDDERTDSGEDTDGFEMDCESDDESGDEALLGRRRVVPAPMRPPSALLAPPPPCPPVDHFGAFIHMLVTREPGHVGLKDLHAVAVSRTQDYPPSRTVGMVLWPYVRTLRAFKAALVERQYAMHKHNGVLTLRHLRLRL